ncbi:hypothetical protein QO002_002396 [Pararhizobium capsulatum DSM 1112]|uniref:Uncharacterized protein n=1 Tax=Pararhizobium capsulatum DSM 1112 TaxID=1121113 RepID=A0ABU0BQM7_9HYPH|nr:hypothetical protein [Pararhizobium capsulatum]MDQ0320258.1 hypothetical protein [Pararhizobium capsulatum DSM 1112]
MEKFFYAIVGEHTNVNAGLGRFILLFIAFMVIGGGAFWFLRQS